MSIFKSCRVIVVGVILLLGSGTAFGLPIAPAGYQLEVFAEYPTGDLGLATDIAVGPDGIVFVTHYGDESHDFTNSSIAVMNRSSVITRWVDGLKRIRSLIWTGGTEFGDYFYMVDAQARVILKLDGEGKTSPLTSHNFRGPSSIDIDRYGIYGGDIFGAPRGTDCIQRIKADGSISVFSRWPGVVSGGVIEIAISPTEKYGGGLFAAYDESKSDERDGLYKIDADGKASKFVDSLSSVRAVEFDISGLMFYNDMFVIGRKPGLEGMHLWRIDETGNAEHFMQVNWGVIDHIAFGPYGEMYLTKYTKEKTQVLRVSLTSMARN